VVDGYGCPQPDPTKQGLARSGAFLWWPTAVGGDVWRGPLDAGAAAPGRVRDVASGAGGTRRCLSALCCGCAGNVVMSVVAPLSLAAISSCSWGVLVDAANRDAGGCLRRPLFIICPGLMCTRLSWPIWGGMVRPMGGAGDEFEVGRALVTSSPWAGKTWWSAASGVCFCYLSMVS
jgi:hypothetical protein